MEGSREFQSQSRKQQQANRKFSSRFTFLRIPQKLIHDECFFFKYYGKILASMAALIHDECFFCFLILWQWSIHGTAQGSQSEVSFEHPAEIAAGDFRRQVNGDQSGTIGRWGCHLPGVLINAVVLMVRMFRYVCVWYIIIYIWYIYICNVYKNIYIYLYVNWTDVASPSLLFMGNSPILFGQPTIFGWKPPQFPTARLLDLSQVSFQQNDCNWAALDQWKSMDWPENRKRKP